MATEAPQADRTAEGTSFAETALKLGGKSADEARRTGAIDTADDQVEALFAPQYQTVNSPAHRAVWDRGVPVELFASAPPKTPPDVQQVMDDSIAVVQRHKAGRHAAQRRRQDRRRRARRSGRGRLLGPAWSARSTAAPARRSARSRRFSRGWRWSIRPSPAWPRCTAASARSIRCARSATPSRSSDSCPGWPAARGCSAFALTEPCAGSDLTALRTTAPAATATSTSSTARSCSSPTSCRAARSAWCA